MENRKNTILLTVIAVATLLVAVVGATFAFFTAQGGDAVSQSVTVQTGTSASSSLGTFTAIAIYADQTNFVEGGDDITGTSTGTVSWTAPGTTPTYTPTEQERTFCYTAVLSITSNDFTGTGELLFDATKDGTNLITAMDVTTRNGDINIPTTAGGDVFKHSITAEAGTTAVNNWTLKVTLVNLDTDQNYNTGKTFNGTLKFTKADCL